MNGLLDPKKLLFPPWPLHTTIAISENSFPHIISICILKYRASGHKSWNKMRWCTAESSFKKQTHTQTHTDRHTNKKCRRFHKSGSCLKQKWFPCISKKRISRATLYNKADLMSTKQLCESCGIAYWKAAFTPKEPIRMGIVSMNAKRITKMNCWFYRQVLPIFSILPPVPFGRHGIAEVRTWD